jgi:thioredoxin 1
MKRKAIFLGIILVLLIAGGALFYFLYLGSPIRQTLARVNDEKITVEEFNREIEKVEEPLREMNREEPQGLLEGMIITKLLLQTARKEGISAPVKTYKDADKEGAPASPEETLIFELMKKKIPQQAEVTQEEVKTFYSIFKDQMEGKPLKEVAPLIEQMIREGKQRQAVEEFVKELRASAKVEIEEERLKKMTVKPPESNSADEFRKALTDGKPALVDFGANSCVPCRQMRPVLKEVEKEYAGKARVLIIDVYKHQGLAREYKIQLLPTLVFFDSKGKEAYRHLGLMEKEKIKAKFKELGAEG